MNIKNLKIQPKLVSLALAGTLASATLTGCNKNVIDLKYNYPQAIIFGEGTATIIEIESWRDYEDGEQIQIKIKNGPTFLTSIIDTKLYDEEQTGITAEDFAKCIKGDDIEINYLGEEKQKTK